jgi:hypothetical protein
MISPVRTITADRGADHARLLRLKRQQHELIFPDGWHLVLLVLMVDQVNNVVVLRSVGLRQGDTITITPSLPSARAPGMHHQTLGPNSGSRRMAFARGSDPAVGGSTRGGRDHARRAFRPRPPYWSSIRSNQAATGSSSANKAKRLQQRGHISVPATMQSA